MCGSANSSCYRYSEMIVVWRTGWMWARWSCVTWSYEWWCKGLGHLSLSVSDSLSLPLFSLSVCVCHHTTPTHARLPRSRRESYQKWNNEGGPWVIFQETRKKRNNSEDRCLHSKHLFKCFRWHHDGTHGAVHWVVRSLTVSSRQESSNFDQGFLTVVGWGRKEQGGYVLVDHVTTYRMKCSSKSSDLI